jgi:hypothetical protein
MKNIDINKLPHEPSMVVHAWNRNAQEAKAEGLWVPDQQVLHQPVPYSKALSK